jgi:hypothetical protein
VAFTEVLFTIVVLELLSSEKPMALTDWPEQVVETAESVNCEGTVAPLVGELTVTLANAENEQRASTERVRADFLESFTESLSRM